MTEHGNIDWIDNYGLILVAFAHMTDWKLLDSELEVVQKKIEQMFVNVFDLKVSERAGF